MNLEHPNPDDVDAEDEPSEETFECRCGETFHHQLAKEYHYLREHA